MSLWQRMQYVAEDARASGNLLSIDNQVEVVSDHGIDFVLRLAPQLIEKIRAGRGPRVDNPFLPPEQALTVEPVGPNHQLILNKFNVLDCHGLVVTNQFVDQTDQLLLSDFNAVSLVLSQVDGLIFYNGGKVAGASQPHRHFQVVPKDMGAGVLPVEQTIRACRHHENAKIFPFQHRLYWLPDSEPETLYDAWLKLEFAWMPYNLLLTREWMLVVPRSRESVDGISVNSLGFAGALLAKDEAERETILQQGPMNLLAAVSCEA